MKKESHNTNFNNEIMIGFHQIRKSSNSLAEDLQYFDYIARHLNEEHLINLLGNIELIEEKIKNIRQKILIQKQCMPKS